MKLAALLLSLLCVVSCAETLPEAGSALNEAKVAFETADEALAAADALYGAVCSTPDTLVELAKPCAALAKALDKSESVLRTSAVALNAAIVAYTAVNDVVKATQ